MQRTEQRFVASAQRSESAAQVEVCGHRSVFGPRFQEQHAYPSEGNE
jgi:hypothetical protein